jgi:hypothetical protein
MLETSKLNKLKLKFCNVDSEPDMYTKLMTKPFSIQIRNGSRGTTRAQVANYGQLKKTICASEEECRILRYKNPVRTSQEAYYVSTTEPSQLMLCKIWDFHGGDYEECRLLGEKNPRARNYVMVTGYFAAFFLAGWFWLPWWWRQYDPRNVGSYKSHATSHPRRRHSS